jgi:N-acetyl-D-muramate 6-phosphate phosphatase
MIECHHVSDTNPFSRRNSRLNSSNMKTNFNLQCVLFDLDGTLVDTAPDLIACLNLALAHHGFAKVPDAQVRPMISFGAEPMIKASSAAEAVEYHQQILETMLEFYENNIVEHGGFFTGMAETLEAIEVRGLKWGIVTNKKERFTHPLVKALDLTERAACIISGDTTPNSKPHPEPMWEACRRAGVQPEQCVFIGDAKHDITAGKNANMKTLAAVYGYLTEFDRPEEWGADALIESPAHIRAWIESVLCY